MVYQEKGKESKLKRINIYCQTFINFFLHISQERFNKCALFPPVPMGLFTPVPEALAVAPSGLAVGKADAIC
jgi:hypothetical protein